ncbi:MAG: D-alanyl-D-alanine carboxypeptidase/D-alanyl-D-alanine-endopeptidase [Armatimonadetes bacterium]|nr:D-alanyl-D-alanine carboxypeptidase/D-alanyl-D-alanine-endopeptidase [Armatimonadota bacterium]
MNPNRRTFVLAVVLIACLSIKSPASELKAAIDALLGDPALKRGVQGVVVESLSTGRVLYEKNSDVALIPASNFKLIVSAAALDRLRPDHTFATHLYTAGRLDGQGALHGDLVLVGGGDPVFSTADLRSLAEDVRRTGIRRVTGAVIADDTLFDDVRLGEGWRWDNESDYYSAQISAICLDRNVVDVYVRPGRRVGATARVTLDPPSGYFTIRNTATTGPPDSENTVFVARARAKNEIRISGSVPLGYSSSKPTEPITMEEPALYAAAILQGLLRRAGVVVEGRAAAGNKPDDAKILVEHRSPPLRDILPLLLKPSDNLIAEVLLKSLGAEIKGEGTAAAGIDVERDFLGRVGLDLDAVAFADASGLSRLNYITPGNLIVLLRYMWSHQHSRIFIDSLPVGGIDGTLRRRMRDSEAGGNVRAKTGHVSRVSNLSGYVTTRSGEPLVFSIMMNNHLCPQKEARRIQDSICELLASLL